MLVYSALYSKLTFAEQLKQTLEKFQLLNKICFV